MELALLPSKGLQAKDQDCLPLDKARAPDRVAEASLDKDLTSGNHLSQDRPLAPTHLVRMLLETTTEVSAKEVKPPRDLALSNQLHPRSDQTLDPVSKRDPLGTVSKPVQAQRTASRRRVLALETASKQAPRSDLDRDL